MLSRYASKPIVSTRDMYAEMEYVQGIQGLVSRGSIPGPWTQPHVTQMGELSVCTSADTSANVSTINMAGVFSPNLECTIRCSHLRSSRPTNRPQALYIMAIHNPQSPRANFRPAATLRLVHFASEDLGRSSCVEINTAFFASVIAQAR